MSKITKLLAGRAAVRTGGTAGTRRSSSLLRDTGMRRVELLGLDAEDVNLTDRTVVIRRAKGNKSEDVPVQRRDGGGRRPLPEGRQGVLRAAVDQ